MEKQRFIHINGEPVAVSEEVYIEYYKHYRKERTQQERDARNRLIYYDAWDTGKSPGAEAIKSPYTLPEDVVVDGMAAEKLSCCIKKLNEEEREIIHALFYCGKTLSSLARELKIPRKTLENRRDRIVRKLRIYFEAPDR